ncbi:hypothetical protein LEMLEM_LOCUS675, partial [Lemmus lemmus]
MLLLTEGKRNHREKETRAGGLCSSWAGMECGHRQPLPAAPSSDRHQLHCLLREHINK